MGARGASGTSEYHELPVIAGAEDGRGDLAGLRRYLQHSSIGCIEWTPDFRVRRCNQAACRMLAYPAVALLDMHAEELLLRKRDRKGFTPVAKQLCSGRVDHVEHVARSRRGDGVPIWCDWLHLVMRDHGGGVAGYFSVIREVTEETLVRRYMDRMASVPAGRSDGWSQLDHVLESIRTVLGADAAVVASIDGSDAVILAGMGGNGPVDLERYALAGTPCAEVVRSDACVINHCAWERFPEDDMLVALQAESYGGVLLRDDAGEALGLLAVMGRWPLGPAGAVRRTLEHAAGRVRLEIQRLRAEEETRLAALAFETHEAIMILDGDYRFVRVNDAFRRLTGYAGEQVQGHGLRLLLGGRNGGEARREIQAALARDGHWNGDVRARNQNGEQRLYRLSVTALNRARDREARFVGSFLDVTWHREAEERIRQLTFEDRVTGLANRAAMLARLEHQQRERGSDGIRGLLVLDLDGFRRVNEGMGYEVADSLLEIQATRLRALVPDALMLARVGADEFAVLLSGEGTGADGTHGLSNEAERLRGAFAHPVEVSGVMVQSGVSVGLVEADEHDPVDARLLARAEIAAAQARHRGGNRIARFAPEMEEETSERLQLEQGLRQAVDNGDVHFHLQPLVDADGRICSLEVLARWKHNGSPVPPARFITIAEQSGLIRPMGAQILRDACHWLAQWQRGHPDRRLPSLAINVSIRQFHDPEFEAIVARVLEETDLPPSTLLLEVTESLLADEGDAVIGRMRRLRELGVRFAIDDFGTGYSCLAYLRRLPIDELKIDGSFVEAMLLSPEDEEIVRTIIAMAQALRLNVVAERVQTREQAERLLSLGCSTLQGFHFYHPLAPALAADAL